MDHFAFRRIRLPRIVTSSKRTGFRNEALKQTLGWFAVLLLVMTISVTGFASYYGSFWIELGFASIASIAVAMFGFFLWETWVDDGRSRR